MCADAGIDGIWGDQQAANAGEVRTACEAAAISIVASVTPAMSLSEIHTELEGANGFVICRLNPPFEAGTESESTQPATSFITGLRELTQLPIALATPVDTLRNVTAAARIADGVLAGPDIHAILDDLDEDDIIPTIGDYIRELKAGTLVTDSV
jgi:tryptophan synthase alpha subunit